MVQPMKDIALGVLEIGWHVQSEDRNVQPGSPLMSLHLWSAEA
jgi:hypothetical protein